MSTSKQPGKAIGYTLAAPQIALLIFVVGVLPLWMILGFIWLLITGAP